MATGLEDFLLLKETLVLAKNMLSQTELVAAVSAMRFFNRIYWVLDTDPQERSPAANLIRTGRGYDEARGGRKNSATRRRGRGRETGEAE